MVKQSNSEVIVVDYGCAQGTDEWVKNNYPNVKVIKFDEDPGFSLSIARNLGLSRANGDWLLFIDADVIIKNDLGKWVLEKAKSQHYYKSTKSSELSGSVILRKDKVEKISGYDEAFRGWGGEDSDFYTRLQMEKVDFRELPSDFFEAISHDNVLRGLEESNGHDPKVKARWIYKGYLKYKYEYFRQNKKFPELSERKKFMQSIKEQADKKSYEELLSLPALPNMSRFGYIKDVLKNTLIYKIYLFIWYGIKK